MKIGRTSFALLALAGLGLMVHAAADSDQVAREKLARVRNIAKAYYENPNQKKEAVAEYRKALDLKPDSPAERLNYGLALLRNGQTDEGLTELKKVQEQEPKLPQTWFNLGIEYKKLGEFEQAIVQLEEMARLVPEEAVTQYNLGVLYKRAGRIEAAIRKFQIATQLDPSLAAPHFQLFNSFRTSGQKERAQKELVVFKRVKEQQKGSVIGEDMNWSFYSEVYSPVEPRAVGSAPAELAFQVLELKGVVDARTAGLAVLDANADGKPNLLVWSASGMALYLDGESPAEGAGLGGLDGVTSVAPGDFDDDGLMDLAVTTTGGAVLLKNNGGKFSEHELGAPGRRFQKALWVDFDHDNDIDLFLLGAKPALMRNQGESGFADRTEDFPFATGSAIDGVAFRLEPDTKMYDMVVANSDGSGTLYRDRLAGHYEVRALFDLPAGARQLVAIDADNDSWVDVAYVAGGKTGLLKNRGGKLTAVRTAASGAPLFADLEGRGHEDLIAGGQVYRNLGAGGFAPGREALGLAPATAGVSADFDGDGKIDLILAGEDGVVRLLENRTSGGARWLHITLDGRKAPKLAPGAEIEVKSGLHYQKKLYAGLPVVFGLGNSQKVDAVRITWSNGLIQNATEQNTNITIAYIEEERLSGSCPMIWTWNGEEFQFITDVLGVGPLGVQTAPGEFFPADHDEYALLPEGALQEKDGAFEIRLSQELAEVVYLDEAKLIAVDHREEVEIFTNEKFRVPPPEFKLFGVKERTYPVSAVDGRGNDVRGRIEARDGRYADTVPRHRRRGVAGLHSLELDFGDGAAPDNNAVLVMDGWVDWADGSTYLGYSQEDELGLVTPYLQVKDERGEWTTVIEQMGMPAGLPKTVVVDLAGKFLSESRAVRIVTNICLYWDEIFLATDAAEPTVRMTELRSGASEVRFRGFARIDVDLTGRRPQRFFYERPEPAAMWSQTPGLYTRYGAVTELLEEVDDRFVIFGAGDEVRLRFSADKLPPLEPGWKRTFILGVDGWEKDQDPNTVTSMSVEPLPFHEMSRYPYPESERYPTDAAHQSYLKEYLTRPAQRLIRPLAVDAAQRKASSPAGE